MSLDPIKVDDIEDLHEKLGEFIEENFRCYHCGEPTDRYITFVTDKGIVDEFECVDCRQLRVKKQVEAGLRPASDLLPENLPENRG